MSVYRPQKWHVKMKNTGNKSQKQAFIIEESSSEQNKNHILLPLKQEKHLYKIRKLPLVVNKF